MRTRSFLLWSFLLSMVPACGTEAEPEPVQPQAAALALGGGNQVFFNDASQSSTALGAEAWRAIDGNRDGNWAKNSVTHTNYENQPWWQMTLREDQQVDSIDIFNRTDCCSERLSNFYVLVSDDSYFQPDSLDQALHTPGVSSYYVAQAGAKLTVPIGRTARTIRIQLAGSNYLSLAEVVANFPVRGGGIDLGRFCHRRMGSLYSPVLQNTSNANSWVCQHGSGFISIDMNEACMQQYGASSVAHLDDPSNPYSWWCTRATFDHCTSPFGSELITLWQMKPLGIAAKGYEVYGEPSQWQVHVATNNAFPNGNTSLSLVSPASFDDNSWDAWITNAGEQDIYAGLTEITPSSPAVHTFTLQAPCGTLTRQTPALTRVNPTEAPVGTITASSTSVDSGATVTLQVLPDLNRLSPTACLIGSKIRVVGRQVSDGQVVLDTTRDSQGTWGVTLTVNPTHSTEYTATTTCNLNPSLQSSARITVTTHGGVDILNGTVLMKPVPVWGDTNAVWGGIVGEGFTPSTGTLKSITNSTIYGVWLVRAGHGSSECQNADAVIYLPPNGTTTDMNRLYGVDHVTLPQSLVACSGVPVNQPFYLGFTYEWPRQ